VWPLFKALPLTVLTHISPQNTYFYERTGPSTQRHFTPKDSP
jgi:hypothetical protein